MISSDQHYQQDARELQQSQQESQRSRADETQIKTLVASAIDGNRRAVEALLQIIRPLVVRYCRLRVSSELASMSADDVAQEVCLAVLKALPSYKEQGKPFLAFVYGIAAHKVVDGHRYAGRDRSVPTKNLPDEVDVAEGPEQMALAPADSAQMRHLLEHLPAKQRDILVMRVVVGLSEEETAEAVGSTPGAVRVAQHRALAKLRELIAHPKLGVTVENDTETADSDATAALADEVLADPQADALAELSESIEGRDPKEFRAHQALIEDIAGSINMQLPATQLAEAYRHRQLTKHLAQDLGGHLEAGVRAVLDARRRGADADTANPRATRRQ